MRGLVTHLQVNYQREQEPHSGRQDVVAIALERRFPADERWDEVLMGQEVGRDAIGRLVSTILLRFVNMTKEAVELQNPSRALAFRGPVEIEIIDRSRDFVPVLVRLRYHCHWSAIEALMHDVELDAEAIGTWLTSKPVPKPEEVATA